ncbi:MAG: CapA family protein, partial [Acidimicrobiia bacterium]|nr:CapA family protein [Acidimicrobiia bacterium]
MRDGDTIETRVEAVEAADQIAELVIVTIHWGVELDTTPRDEDWVRAEAMIAAGADAIFGHHPHRLQPFDVVGGRPVAWSLGNFVWPNLSTAGSTTAIARVVVSPGGEVTGCLTAFISSPGHPVITGEAECGPGDRGDVETLISSSLHPRAWLPEFDLVPFRIPAMGEPAVAVLEAIGPNFDSGRDEFRDHFIQIVDPVVDHEVGARTTEILGVGFERRPHRRALI